MYCCGHAPDNTASVWRGHLHCNDFYRYRWRICSKVHLTGSNAMWKPEAESPEIQMRVRLRIRSASPARRMLQLIASRAGGCGTLYILPSYLDNWNFMCCEFELQSLSDCALLLFLFLWLEFHEVVATRLLNSTKCVITEHLHGKSINFFASAWGQLFLISKVG